MKTEFVLQAVVAANAAILTHESEIESLDRAIGDGDHLVNLKRGVAAIVAMHDELVVLPADVALQRIGMKLLSAVGGAAGPLFASFSWVWPTASRHMAMMIWRALCRRYPPALMRFSAVARLKLVRKP